MSEAVGSCLWSFLQGHGSGGGAWPKIDLALQGLWPLGHVFRRWEIPKQVQAAAAIPQSSSAEDARGLRPCHVMWSVGCPMDERSAFIPNMISKTTLHDGSTVVRNRTLLT